MNEKAGPLISYHLPPLVIHGDMPPRQIHSLFATRPTGPTLNDDHFWNECAHRIDELMETRHALFQERRSTMVASPDKEMMSNECELLLLFCCHFFCLSQLRIGNYALSSVTACSASAATCAILASSVAIVCAGASPCKAASCASSEATCAVRVLICVPAMRANASVSSKRTG